MREKVQKIRDVGGQTNSDTNAMGRGRHGIRGYKALWTILQGEGRVEGA